MKRHTLWLPILVLAGTIVALIIPGTLSSAAFPVGVPLAASAGRASAPLAPEATATFFIAHPGGAEATPGNRIPAPGGAAVTFEVRMRDAGSGDKAGWQVDSATRRVASSGSPVVMSLVGNVFPNA